jgi:hypothetical protein
MKEKDRILSYNNGEIPSGEHDIIRIKNISNPERELGNLKETIIAFLENKELESDDPKWEVVLSQAIIKFTKQLDSNDFHKDDLITGIPNIIDGMQNIREWEWYSSKVIDNGFEIRVLGIFRYIFRHLIHQHGIPHTSIFVERNGIEYPTRSLTDVLTYRTWNPDTFELD